VSLPTLLGLLLGLSLTAYATLAGADFGAGILDLLAGDRAADREAIAATIGPVWEANHVWLIFSITILFAAFPAAFSALGTALLGPLTIALLAVVLRGVALGLRATADPGTRARVALSRMFGAASLSAPFVFGAVAGGLAAASSAPAGEGGRLAARAAVHIPWAGAFGLLTGALAAVLCTQLASSFVALGLARAGDRGKAEWFRLRGLQAGALTLVLSLAAPALAAAAAPRAWHGLLDHALPILIVGLGACAAFLYALWRRRYGLARAAGLLTGAALLWGWFAAQYPHLVGPRLTLDNTAATHAALAAVAVAAGAVLLLVLPAMYLLFAVSARPELEVSE